MFNIGDRVKCTSGGFKGRHGIVMEHISPFSGMARIEVLFDGDIYTNDLWTHRFILETPVNKMDAIVAKIKQMESRQTWKKIPA